MTPSTESWFIVKQASHTCKILSSAELEAIEQTDETTDADAAPTRWGPFETQNQAIAKRVGLIRAGKCQPS
ncbi:MAG: hypothetical protein ACFB16_14660 [Phormidesmis sp.]